MKQTIMHVHDHQGPLLNLSLLHALNLTSKYKTTVKEEDFLLNDNEPGDKRITIFFHNSEAGIDEVVYSLVYREYIQDPVAFTDLYIHNS